MEGHGNGCHEVLALVIVTLLQVDGNHVYAVTRIRAQHWKRFWIKVIYLPPELSVRQGACSGISYAFIQLGLYPLPAQKPSCSFSVSVSD